MPAIIRLAPEGWTSHFRMKMTKEAKRTEKQEEQTAVKEEEDDDEIKVSNQDVKGAAKRSAWARLIKKVYGIDPLICDKCGSEMCIVSFIVEPEQVEKIMYHLKKQGRAPPGIAYSPTI